MPSSKTRRKKRSLKALAGASTALVPYKSFGANPVSAALGALGALAVRSTEKKLERKSVKKMMNVTGADQKSGLVRSLAPFRRGPGGYGDRTDQRQLTKFRALAYESIGQLQSGEGLRPPVNFRYGLDFHAAGMPQRDVDRTFRTAIRVVVTDIDAGGQNLAIAIGAGGSAGATRTQALVAASASSSGNASGVQDYAPTKLSPLLQIIGEAFQFYAIRYGLHRFIPVASVYQVAGSNPPLLVAPNTNVAVGIVSDPDSANSTVTTFAQVNELEHSATNQVTKPFELEYCMTGTNLWSNFNTAGETDMDVQARLVAFFDNPMPVSTAATTQFVLMHHQVFAIVDYYGIRNLVSADESPRICERVRALGGRVDKDEKTGEIVLRLAGQQARVPSSLLKEDYVSVEAQPRTDGRPGPRRPGGFSSASSPLG